MNKSAFVVTALTGWLLVGASVAAPQFVQGPSARYAHTMAYDSQRQVVVLFGGSDGASVNAETWEWDGSSWTQRLPLNAPPALLDGAMCFDSARGVSALFGGYVSGTPSNETWEWDGTDWSLRSVANSPSPRFRHSLVYDDTRQVAVLFAGSDYPASSQCSADLQDTWEWDGVNWSAIQPLVVVPPVRQMHAMTFGSNTWQALLFGGHDACVSNQSDTWQFDGANWAQTTTISSPPAVHGHSLCEDGAGALLFGGANSSGSSTYAETWQWSGSGWQQLSTQYAPHPRYQHQAVLHAASGRVVLFGGRASATGQVFGDTWAFDGTEWHPKLDYVTSQINGSRYALTPPMTWPEAEGLAVFEGGHLATVRNQAEQNWLAQSFTAGNLWIGLSDAATEGQWVWASGESANFTNWCPGEPNNIGNQDYANMNGCVGSSSWDDGGVGQLQGIIELHVAAPSNATTYGAGCGTPALGFFPTANPIIGTTAGALITNAPTLAAGVTMGWSDTYVNGLPILPFDLAGLGLSGCFLLHSNDAFGLPTTPLTSSTLQFGFAIPFTPSLLSAHVYIQAFCIAPGVNAAQVVTSNGIDWLIGNQ